MAGMLGACAAPGPAAPEASVAAGWVSCEAAGAPLPVPGRMYLPGGDDQQGLPRLPADFTPVAVTVCGPAQAVRPDGGENVTASERRTEDRAAVTALADALRLPDAPGTAEACTLEGLLLPWFVLHDANGNWVRPGLPAGECGKPRAEVLAALTGLPLTPVSETPVGESRSGLSARTGCADTYADMVWVTTGSGPDVPPAAPPPGADRQMRLCLYRVADEFAGDAAPGVKRAGDLEAGTVLDADRWAALRAEFPPPARAAGCAAPAMRFAVLTPVPGGPPTTVELDGCRRSVQDGAGLAAGGPALTAAIEAAA